VAAWDKAGIAQSLAECCYTARASGGIGCVEKPDHRYRWPLRARRNPPCRRAAEKRDEIAASDHYLTTSSAMASNDGGNWRPSSLAVKRLMIRSNLLARITGRSEGFSPLRMRPT